MNLGEVIRTYRKEKQMTQEEMAGYLGVTAPAVNKWEKGNSFPDIRTILLYRQQLYHYSMIRLAKRNMKMRRNI